MIDNITFGQLAGIALILLVLLLGWTIMANGFPQIIIHKKCNCKKDKK